ncbi:hypothetical protein QP426_07750 [Pauljensenia sp. UMB1235]|uniref:hypothetical protein n=1 Tax=unclassified Pauljensenia TaxID=2908895 RepID=UPI00254F6A72|nr:MULTISPECIES: hypothetical protein [unclassified Pauljensenia]MDK6400289.1 hypothetical protein [Pauljensenia sp. UMB9872]MDK7173543.1 hypothetical protein [Pauljensenia sp. UMB1235]
MTSVRTEHQPQTSDVEPAFEHGLEQTVLPGRGLTLCAPTRRDLYQNRLADCEGDPAELFQINARWRRGAFDELPDVTEQQALRKWFHSSGRVFSTTGSDTGPMVPLRDVPAPLGPALLALADAGSSSGLLFAADIIVLTEGWAHLLPSGQRCLVKTRTFSDQQRTDLVDAVVPDARDAFAAALSYIAIVASPQRLQVTHGPRGYRNALMEVGMLVGNVGNLMATHRMRPSVTVDFIDTTVDRTLDLDGVERFAAALVALNPDHDENRVQND